MRIKHPVLRLIVPGILLAATLGSALTLRTQASILRPFGDIFFTASSGSSPKSDTDTTHLLLISLDRRETAEPLPESIVLCSIHRDSGTMTAAAIDRDLYVEVPGGKGGSIYAAYKEGGMPLLRKTLEECLELELAGCIGVDLSGLPQLVDARGGIKVYLEPEEAQAMNEQAGSSLAPGDALLDGAQALDYWYLRLPGQGETEQARRQKALICAFWGQCSGLELGQMRKLLREIAPLLSTDIRQTRLLGLALDIIPLLPRWKVSSHRLPAEGTCTRQAKDGLEVQIATPEMLRQQLSEILSQ